MRPNLVDTGGSEHHAPRPYDREVSNPGRPLRRAAYRPWRLAVTTLAVLAVFALGVVAGRWQWERYTTKSDAVAAQQRAEDAAVVNVREVVSVSDADAGEAQWRTVTAVGTLDSAAVIELRGRSIDAVASIQYVTWLHVNDGTAVVVNLGWLPRASATMPTLPAGQVTVTGVVRDLEPRNDRPGTRITPADMSDPGGPILPLYLMARSVCGPQECFDALAPVPEPSLSLGPHLSYAMQWWLLAVAAAPIAIALTRRDARLEREGLLKDDGRAEPGSTEPGSTEPGSTEPGNIEPGSTESDSTEPADGEPSGATPVSESIPPTRRTWRRWDRYTGPSDEEVEDAL